MDEWKTPTRAEQIWEGKLRSRKSQIKPPSTHPTPTSPSPQQFITDPSKAVLSLCYFLLNALKCFTYKRFSFNNCVSEKYIQLSLGNRAAILEGKGLPTPLSICSFVAILSVFPFDNDVDVIE